MTGSRGWRFTGPGLSSHLSHECEKVFKLFKTQNNSKGARNNTKYLYLKALIFKKKFYFLKKIHNIKFYLKKITLIRN